MTEHDRGDAGSEVTASGFLDTGLDLEQEAFSEEERTRLEDWYAEHHDVDGLDLAAFARFQVHHDPGGFKRGRRYIFSLAETGRLTLPLPVAILLFAYSYTVMGYGEGVFYETIALRKLGARKREVLGAIRLAGLDAGPRGLGAVGRLMTGYLDDWAETDADGIAWPPSWVEGSEVLRSGIGATTGPFTEDELAASRAWYRRLYGEVPDHVEFLAQAHPAALKAAVQRFDGALDGSLPARFVPLCWLHFGVLGRDQLQVRRAVRLATQLGVEPDEALSAMLWAAYYGGDRALEPALEAALPLLRRAIS